MVAHDLQHQQHDQDQPGLRDGHVPDPAHDARPLQLGRLIRQPIVPTGMSAVALLVNQMETVTAQPEELLFEPELVVRRSTGPAPLREA